VDCAIVPDNTIQVFALADDYSFGILQSGLHWEWFKAKCSKLKADYRYTVNSVFNTFPFPQNPLAREVQAVADAGLELRRLRTEALKSIGGGLRDLYRSLEVPGSNRLVDAHVNLDEAVRAAYNFNDHGDTLADLLHLNRAVARLGAAGQGPGIPQSYPDPLELVSQDRMIA
jgi:hypothetical protein